MTFLARYLMYSKIVHGGAYNIYKKGVRFRFLCEALYFLFRKILGIRTKANQLI